ncbi:MAG: hypothetical protein HY813_00230 [Candidatus Portnoybacteria bacterium]|nr:hypothetical protein [Candidatus Portnoybacteria bacterium]
MEQIPSMETKTEKKTAVSIDAIKYYKFIFPAIVLAAVAGLAVYGYFHLSKKSVTLGKDAIMAKAEKFINEQLVSPGTTASISDMSEENGLYKLTIKAADQSLTAYVSEDGKNFFPQVFDMDTWKNPQSQQQPQQPAEKTDIPEVKLFVMSYCPYGLQAEKGILPVVDLLGSKIKFSLKFVDYAMHGEKEIDENLRQYCLGRQGFDKLSGYLKCFAEKADSAVCLKAVKIDVNALSGCVAAADAQFEIKKKFKDQNAWANSQYPPFDIDKDDNIKYNVQGSPTLVINGVTVSSGRDPQSLLNAICFGFSAPPSECGQNLSSDAPSPSFGAGAGSNGNASCGN